MVKVKELFIRPKKVLEALKWLKLNNHLYNNVTIDDTFFKSNEPFHLDHKNISLIE